MNTLPIIDLHCDLLSYLAKVPNATPYDIDAIGAAKPHLQKGNVKVQVTAIFTTTSKGSSYLGSKQAQIYDDLLQQGEFHSARSTDEVKRCLHSDGTGILCAIENASSFCEEDEPLENGLQRLEKMIEKTGKMLYIMLTHHTENRFGGGNYSDNVGIKDDGKRLLDYLDNRKIAIDLSHASDALAYDIINHVDRQNLNIPIIASHSNFRPLHAHVRNLPDELSQEIIRRDGLIGINFLRDYISETNHEALYDHFQYAFDHDAGKAISFGADFFYLKAVPGRDWENLFFTEFGDGSKYPNILDGLADKFGFSDEQLERIAWQNVVAFLERMWENNP